MLQRLLPPVPAEGGGDCHEHRLVGNRLRAFSWTFTVPHLAAPPVDALPHALRESVRRHTVGLGDQQARPPGDGVQRHVAAVFELTAAAAFLVASLCRARLSPSFPIPAAARIRVIIRCAQRMFTLNNKTSSLIHQIYNRKFPGILFSVGATASGKHMFAVGSPSTLLKRTASTPISSNVGGQVGYVAVDRAGTMILYSSDGGDTW